jgi:hypothetical protein
LDLQFAKFLDQAAEDFGPHRFQVAGRPFPKAK